jgi:hypothetical protein
LLGSVLFLAISQAPALTDVDGRDAPLFTPSAHTQVIVFVATDCPISNGYAPEIQRTCRDYSARGVRCSLVYEDANIDAPGVRRHLIAYGYHDVAAVIDRSGALARRAAARVTPEAVVVDRRGEIRYRGRIDNFYAALGKPRRRATTHELRDALDAVLAGTPVRVPRTEALGCYITPTGAGQ